MAGDFTFLKGNIEMIILNALYNGDKYGYEIAREIKERTENQYEIKQPTLYAYLKRLENQGQIHSYWGAESNGGRRRYYTLTEQGKNDFIKFSAEWKYQKNVLDNLVDTDEDTPSITQEEATPLFGTKSRRAKKKIFDIDEYDNQQLIAKKLAEIASQNSDPNPFANNNFASTNLTSTNVSDTASTNNNFEQPDYTNETTSKDVSTHSYENLVKDEQSNLYNDISQSKLDTDLQYTEQTLATDTAKTKVVEQEEIHNIEEVKVKVITDDDKFVMTATIEDAPINKTFDNNDFAQINSNLTDNISKHTTNEQTIIESKIEENISNVNSVNSTFIETSVQNNSTSDQQTNNTTQQQSEYKKRFEVHQDTPEQFMQNFDKRAKEMSEKRQSTYLDDVDYQKVLGSVIGNQLDEMQTYNNSNPDERYTFANDRPVALEDIGDQLATEGIRMRIYNRTTAVYRSKKLAPLNKIYCLTSWLTFGIVALMFGILLLLTFKQGTVIPFSVTTGILIIAPLIFTFVYLSDPSRKQLPVINFKILFTVCAIIAIIVAMFAFGLNILFFNLKFINFGAVATQVGIPIIIGICPLLAVFIFKLSINAYSK